MFNPKKFQYKSACKIEQLFFLNIAEKQWRAQKFFKRGGAVIQKK